MNSAVSCLRPSVLTSRIRLEQATMSLLDLPHVLWGLSTLFGSRWPPTELRSSEFNQNNRTQHYLNNQKLKTL
ncbi:hypothetical protein RJT34_31787 [Clitoria ternatea]|uniref:Uncharacterized protein n=1 Tax=Clitoria ternatea TaxID=43366 RepID=A0AAN9EUU4_CLITE